jgi:uncharacterized protein
VSVPEPDLTRLLGRDYWMVLSTPLPHTDQDAVQRKLSEHVGWLLGLERNGVLFVSGPLLSGPGVRPGSGMTVLRAPDEDAARAIAAADPFVTAGLRTFEVYRWRLNEGSIAVSLSLGTGQYGWS